VAFCASPRPRSVRPGRVLEEVGPERGREPRGMLVEPARDPDEAGIIVVVVALLLEVYEGVEEPTHLGVGELLVLQPRDESAFPSPRLGASDRHVGLLVPVEQVVYGAQVVYLLETVAQLAQLLAHLDTTSPVGEAALSITVTARPNVFAVDSSINVSTPVIPLTAPRPSVMNWSSSSRVGNSATAMSW